MNARKELENQVRITPVKELGFPIERVREELKLRLAALIPVEQQKELSWFDELSLKAEALVRATGIAAKWTFYIIRIIYWWITMDWPSIIRFAGTVITTILVNSLNLVPDMQIAGVELVVVVNGILFFIAGWFLPQLKQFWPDWLKQLFKVGKFAEKKKDETP